MYEEQEIGRELFGYNKDDVDKLLAGLHRELRIAREENEKIKEHLTSAKEKLSMHAGVSDAHNKTIVSAENSPFEIIDGAQNEAEIIVAKAEGEASNSVGATSIDRKALESSYRAPGIAEQDLHARIKSILDTYMNHAKEAGPEADSTAEQAATAPNKAPQNKQTAPIKGETNFPENSKGVIANRLSHLADIQGVVSTWVFDNKANIISSFNRLEIDLQGITSALVSLDTSTDQLETELKGERIELMFIEFNKVVLVINMLTDTTTLGVMSVVNAPIGQILWYLNKEVPGLRNVLS